MRKAKFALPAKENFPRTNSVQIYVHTGVKRILLAMCIVGTLASFGSAQDSDPLGSSNPASYKLSTLPNDLVGVEIQTTKDNLQSLMMLSMNSMAIRSDSAAPGLTPEVLYSLSAMVWAPKDQILGSSEYLICYKLAMSPAETKVGVNADSMIFRVTYLKRSSIIAFTPVPEYAPNKLKELASGGSKPAGTVAQRTATLSNIKQVALGIIMWQSDNDDYFPYVQGTPQLGNVIQPYIKNMEVFKSLNPKGSALRFNMCLAGATVLDVQDPAGTPLIYEAEAWDDGRRCVGFVDGHAKVLTADEWNALQPKLSLKLARKGKPIPPQK